MAEKRKVSTSRKFLIAYLLLVVIAAVISVIVIIVINTNSEPDYEIVDENYIPCWPLQLYDSSLNELEENGNDLSGNAFKGSARDCVPVCVWVPSAFGDKIINADEIYFFRFAVFEYELGYPEMYLFQGPETFYNPIPGGLQIIIGEANIIDGFSFDGEIVGVELDMRSEECFGYDHSGRRV